MYWLVVVFFLVNFFVIEEGSDLYEWVGYVVMGVIILCLGWGGIIYFFVWLMVFMLFIFKVIEYIKEVV